MKYIMYYLLPLLLSCNKTGEIIIKNQSDLKFDSSFLSINNHKFKLGEIKSKDSIKIKFDRDLVTASHDVIYYLTLTTKDSLLSSEIFFSNDLGYVPDTIKLEITKGLKVIPY